MLVRTCGLRIANEREVFSTAEAPFSPLDCPVLIFSSEKKFPPILHVPYAAVNERTESTRAIFLKS